MQIEISKSEIELLDKALEVWEKDASSQALMGLMLHAMVGPKASEDELNDKTEKRMKLIENETQSRRVKSVFLRAKLFQALARGTGI